MSNQKQQVIGRRVEASIDAIMKDDCETALINIFPALDKTASLRYPSYGVGRRIKSLLNTSMPYLTFFSIGSVIRSLTVQGRTLPEAIYEFGRCPIAHEGELDSRLVFTDSGSLSIGDKWVMPKNFIWALIITVLVSEENSLEILTKDITITYQGKNINLNLLWGKPQILINMFPILTPPVVYEHNNLSYTITLRDGKPIFVHSGDEIINDPLSKEIIDSYNASLE